MPVASACLFLRKTNCQLSASDHCSSFVSRCVLCLFNLSSCFLNVFFTFSCLSFLHCIFPFFHCFFIFPILTHLVLTFFFWFSKNRFFTTRKSNQCLFGPFLSVFGLTFSVCFMFSCVCLRAFFFHPPRCFLSPGVFSINRGGVSWPWSHCETPAATRQAVGARTR